MVVTVVSHYSILRYFPDPTNGECINVGVFAYDQHFVYGRFLTDLSRAQAISGNADLTWLRDQLTQFKARTRELSPKDLERMRHWMNSLQLGPACASTCDPEALLNRMAPHLLVEPGTGSQDSPDTSEAVVS